MITTSDQELFHSVEKAVRTVLNLRNEELLPTTTFIGDLGAESIDFLDLSCELEKISDTEIDFRKLFQAKRLQSKGGAVDLTLEDIVEHLKTQVTAQK
jgi:acyl carrier protein